MISFIDDHREANGVEPICNVLPIAPSTYREHAAQRRDPARLSARVRRDLELKPQITLVFAENFAVARRTVEGLMSEMGLQDVIRGKPVRTTISDKAAPCPLDQVNRQFHASAPNRAARQSG